MYVNELDSLDEMKNLRKTQYQTDLRRNDNLIKLYKDKHLINNQNTVHRNSLVPDGCTIECFKTFQNRNDNKIAHS